MEPKKIWKIFKKLKEKKLVRDFKPRLISVVCAF